MLEKKKNKMGGYALQINSKNQRKFSYIYIYIYLFIYKFKKLGAQQQTRPLSHHPSPLSEYLMVPTCKCASKN